MQKRYCHIICFFILSTIYLQAQAVVFTNGASIKYLLNQEAPPVVHSALSILEGDLKKVLNASLSKSNNSNCKKKKSQKQFDTIPAIRFLHFHHCDTFF